MKTHLLAAAFVMATAAFPAFACTPEEASAKATELATKMQELAATNPQKLAELSQKLSKAQTQAVTDINGACAVYDDLLSQLK